MGQLEEMNASLAAMKASLKAIERQNAATRVDELAAVVVKQNAELRAAMIQQHAELRQDVIKQNADNAVLLLKQTAALIAAVQEQTKANEKLAAPVRESGKRKRAEDTAADAGNERETSATDSQTSAAEKLVSSSLKGKGPADAGEGTSTARGSKKKMKAPAPAPSSSSSPLQSMCPRPRLQFPCHSAMSSQASQRHWSGSRWRSSPAHCQHLLLSPRLSSSSRSPSPGPQASR